MALTGNVYGSQSVAKAWVSFDGTGTVAIEDSFNVTSITDNGTGDYDVNFTTSMGNVYYAASVFAVQYNCKVTTRLTTDVQIGTANTAHAAADSAQVQVIVFGD